MTLDLDAAAGPARIAAMTCLVKDYDEAIEWFTGCLGFVVVEDAMVSPEKRWVRVAPTPDSVFCLLLARAAAPDQLAQVGKQRGGRVFGFLRCMDSVRDHARMAARGVRFLQPPRRESYGQVCVFEDLYGNRWDLIGPP